MDNGQINLLNDIKDSLTEEELLEYKINGIENYINEHAINKINLQAFFSNFFLEELTAFNYISSIATGLQIGLQLDYNTSFYTEEDRELLNQIAPILDNALDKWLDAEHERTLKYKKINDRETREEIQEIYKQLAPYRDKYNKYSKMIDAINTVGWIRYIEQTADYNLIISDIKSILDNVEIGKVERTEPKQNKKEYFFTAELQRGEELIAYTLGEVMYIIKNPNEIAKDFIPQYIALVYHNHNTSEAIQLIKEKTLEIEKILGIDPNNAPTIRENIPSFTLPPIRRFLQTKDKISRNLPNLQWGVRTEIARESDQQKKKRIEITTYVQLDYVGNNPNIDLYYLRSIYWALLTEQLEHKIRNTTPIRIHRIITRNSNNQPTKEQEEKIIEYCKELKNCELIIDATQEAKSYNYKQLGLEISGELGQVSIVKAKINGQITDNAILFNLDISPLTIYATETKGIISTDFNLLEAPAQKDSINKTQEATNIEDYLYYRIESIGHIGTNDNVIVIDNLLEKCGITLDKSTNKNTYYTRKKRAFKKIRAILNGYKQTGYIKDYAEVIQANKLYSIKIIK